jgi:DNA invertase Pin-like site-specific DNA recombinase
MATEKHTDTSDVDKPRRVRRRATTLEIDFQPRTYAYTRVSTAGQADDGQSLDVQETQLRGWAMQHRREISEMMVESGVSGGVPFQDRPQGRRLWEMVKRGDAIVATKLDRAFRSASDCLATVEAFKARGVSLYLLDLNGGADDVSGNGIARLFLSIVSAFAEFERDRIGERIRATKQAQKARGEYSGGKVTFGYRVGEDGTLVPEAAQQRAVATIRALRAEGKSFRAIAQAVTASGVPISHVGVRLTLARNEIHHKPDDDRAWTGGWDGALDAYGERFGGGGLTSIAVPFDKIPEAARLLRRAIAAGEPLDNERLFRGLGLEPPITDGSVVL